MDVEHAKKEQSDNDAGLDQFIEREESVSLGLEHSEEKLPMSPLSDLDSGIKKTEDGDEEIEFLQA